jgi:DNA adenine methylase
MQYFGGKAKIAKELSKELQSRLKEGQAFVDLFCGSCNVVSKIKAPVRIANDLHKELIALHKAVQEGWIPPSSISELEYKEIKNSNEVSDYLKAFVGFGCSFAGRYFEGYARGGRQNYASGSANSLLKKHTTMQDVVFTTGNYSDIEIPNSSLIYCDIPYKSSTKKYKYGWFQHETFYLWAKEMKDKGHTVLVSEYLQNIPEGWVVEWQYESKMSVRNKEGVQESTVEILMSP